MDIHYKISAMFCKGDNFFATFSLQSVHQAPLKRGLLKEKKMPEGSKFFPAVYPLFRRDQNNLKDLPPLKVHQSPLRCTIFRVNTVVIYFTEPTSDFGSRIQFITVLCFIAQNLSLSPFCRLDKT